MIKTSVAAILFLFLSLAGMGQSRATVYEGEIGFTVGAAHYFGDLNNNGRVNRPKPAVGIYFRKQFGDYIGVRLGAHFAQVGYSDKYSDNEYQRRRNLSFNSNIWEIALQGDFNFFRYEPGNPEYRFTPYVTIGLGLFNFDPYAYLNNQKYLLRNLGTEGQGSSLYPDRQPYSPVAFCFPIGMGVKYNIRNNINLTFEISHRFTNTDYLDDVSKTYAGASAFTAGSPAALLQDRSYEVGTPIGDAGRQRGFSAQKDQYIFVELGLSLTLTSYHCPTAKY
jgi:Domain of unknown function (DUF6089)